MRDVPLSFFISFFFCLLSNTFSFFASLWQGISEVLQLAKFWFILLSRSKVFLSSIISLILLIFFYFNLGYSLHAHNFQFNVHMREHLQLGFIFNVFLRLRFSIFALVVYMKVSQFIPRAKITFQNVDDGVCLSFFLVMRFSAACKCIWFAFATYIDAYTCTYI